MDFCLDALGNLEDRFMATCMTIKPDRKTVFDKRKFSCFGGKISVGSTCLFC